MTEMLDAPGTEERHCLNESDEGTPKNRKPAQKNRRSAGENRKRGKLWVLAGALPLVGLCGVFVARASDVDAKRVLGMESAADWTPSSGATVSLSDQRTQGEYSIAIQTDGYTTVTSRLVGPLGEVADSISVDLNIPAGQPSPSWSGAMQAFVSAPSLDIYQQYLGQMDLGGVGPGGFTRVSFPLSPELRSALSGVYYDLSIQFVLNVPAGVSDPYLIDNVQVSSTIPGMSTIGPEDLQRELGFEPGSDWTSSSGAVSTAFAPRSQGNASLEVIPNGYTELMSVPMVSIAPVDDTIGFDLWVPETQPDPTWWGAVQLYVDAPSLGIYNAYVGEQELTGLSTNQFNNIDFDLDPDLKASLDATNYSDLRFFIALNVLDGASAHYFDNFRVGQVTNPPERVNVLPRADLVGVTHAGVGVVSVDGDEANAPLLFTDFQVKAIDENCVPSSSEVCRYSLTTMDLRFGGFSVHGIDFSTVKILNNEALNFTLGGSYGYEFTIPQSAEFVAWVDTGSQYVLSLHPTQSTTFSLSPSGAGFMSLSGTFDGKVSGKDVSIAIVVAADSPLENRPPVANAGIDQSVQKASGDCELAVNFDGSGSSDPDQNIAMYLWTTSGATIGRDEQVTFTFTQSGTYPVDLRVYDAFRSVGHDQMLLTVALPPGCPSL